MNAGNPTSDGKTPRWCLKDWIPVLVVFATIAPSALAWYLNEGSARKAEEFRRKEERYIALLDSLPGFIAGAEDKERQAEYIRQLRLCWLYCPDEVITAGQQFLVTILDSNRGKFSGDDTRRAVQDLVHALRTDLLEGKRVTDTKLKSEDFIIFSQQKKPTP